MIEYTVRVDEDKTEWYLNGQPHREDGPAIEFANGTKYWCLDGKRHRVDGPAIEWANGDKTWYLNGQVHRVDGPAVERADGTRAWYLYEEYLSEAEFKRRTQVKELTIAQLEELLGYKIKVVGE